MVGAYRIRPNRLELSVLVNHKPFMDDHHIACQGQYDDTKGSIEHGFGVIGKQVESNTYTHSESTLPP